MQIFRATESERVFWLFFIAVLAVVFLLHAKPVPFSNEFVYLLRLDSQFLPNDWTFSQPANEHWLFNTIFSFPTRFLTVEWMGWIGRIFVWCGCLAGGFKLGRLWNIPTSAVAASIILWLLSAQSVVGDEWIFGGFEAKTVAYICLFFALTLFAREKFASASVLVGLSFSFHPAVGMWAAFAVGLSLLALKRPLAELFRTVGLTALFSLPGLIPLLGSQAAASPTSFDDWRFMVIYRLPWHLDPFQFSKSGSLLLFAMLLFNLMVLWKTKSFALRFFLYIQIFFGAFFAFGYVFRWMEMYRALSLMPMRLFPVITPLFFLFTAFGFVPKLEPRRSRLLAAAFVLAVVLLLNPFGRGISQISSTVEGWSKPPTDMQLTAQWIAANTPPDAVVIQPPAQRSVWYFSHRASVASYTYPTYDRLHEWRERIADLSSSAFLSSGENAAEELESAYSRLTPDDIVKLREKYHANYLVSRAAYAYPVLFRTDTYKIYQLF